VTKITIKSWDLSSDDHMSDELIDVGKPFYYNLNLRIEFKGIKGSQDYVLGLTNFMFLKKHKRRLLNHILILDEPIYPSEIVKKIEAFLGELNPVNYKTADQFLREVFISEFASNTARMFENHFTQ